MTAATSADTSVVESERADTLVIMDIHLSREGGR
jgi:hypothetical protein